MILSNLLQKDDKPKCPAEFQPEKPNKQDPRVTDQVTICT